MSWNVPCISREKERVIMSRNRVPVDVAGVAAPTLIFTVDNALISNPVSAAVVKMMQDLYKKSHPDISEESAVKFRVFGGSFDLSSKGIDRNSVALFDGDCRREFSFLVRDDTYEYPLTAAWMKKVPSLWSVVLHKKSQKKQPYTVDHCANLASAVFVKRFDECEGVIPAIQAIKNGHYPWGPRKTAERKPRKRNRYENAREAVGFYDHTLAI